MSSDNFDDIVTSDSSVWVVNFYDSAAAETEKWASTWSSLKSEIQEVKFASVDVESKKGLKLAKDLGLAGSMPVVAMVNHKDGADPVVLMKGEVQQLTRIRKKVLHNTKDLHKVAGYWQKEKAN